MTGGMKFNENMVNINWKRVRWICDIGYTFMSKEKGVKFKKIDLNGVNSQTLSLKILYLMELCYIYLVDVEHIFPLILASNESFNTKMHYQIDVDKNVNYYILKYKSVNKEKKYSISLDNIKFD